MEVDKFDSDHHYQEAGEGVSQANCRQVEEDVESHYQTPRMSRMTSKYVSLLFLNRNICPLQTGEQVLYQPVV